MSKDHTVFVIIEAQPGKEDVLKNILLRVTPINRSQAESKFYKWYQSKTNPCEFVLCAKWTSEQGHQDVLGRDYVGKFFDETQNLMARPYQIIMSEEIEDSTIKLN